MNKLRLLAITVTVSTLGVCMQVSGAEPALEPAVDTSALPPAAAPAAAAPAKAGTPAADKAAAATGKAPAGQKAAPAARGTRRAQDRLELDVTQVTGNSELPRVLYVVPWKRSDLGDLTGRPVNSLLDEVLAPVDRDVFRRQNRYYEALRPDTAGGGSGRAAPEVEK